MSICDIALVSGRPSQCPSEMFAWDANIPDEPISQIDIPHEYDILPGHLGSGFYEIDEGRRTHSLLTLDV